MPPEQVCPTGQELVQAPQFRVSVSVSTQVPEQSVWPAGGRPGEGAAVSQLPVVVALVKTNTVRLI